MSSSDPIMDFLPSHERKKLKRMMSPEAYEKLRERVKGPEDLAREMARSERLAELRFESETKQETREALKKQAEKDVSEGGAESVFELADASPEATVAVEQGRYVLQVSSHPSTHQDALVGIPEGTVQEKLPVKPAVADRYLGQMLGAAPASHPKNPHTGHGHGHRRS